MFRNRRYGAVAVAGAVVVWLGSVSFVPAAGARDLPTDGQCKELENPDAVIKGSCTAINRAKGNCLACHIMPIESWPQSLPPGGNIGPPLIGMSQRFDKDGLRNQVWDALQVNPRSVMPPFGRHHVLTDEEVDNIVEFLLTI